MKDGCCKKFEKKKACKDCPVLLKLRTAGYNLKRKEVGAYVAAADKKEKESPLYA